MNLHKPSLWRHIASDTLYIGKLSLNVMIKGMPAIEITHPEIIFPDTYLLYEATDFDWWHFYE